MADAVWRNASGADGGGNAFPSARGPSCSVLAFNQA